DIAPAFEDGPVPTEVLQQWFLGRAGLRPCRNGPVRTWALASEVSLVALRGFRREPLVNSSLRRRNNRRCHIRIRAFFPARIHRGHLVAVSITIGNAVAVAVRRCGIR